MKSFYKDEVKTCAEIMSTAKNPEDALAAWLHLDREHADLVGIVCLDSYKRSVLPFSIEKYMKEPLNYLVPYFKNTHIYFLDNEIVNDILNARTVNFGVDYSLMLDTNIASYINKLVRGESLGQMQRKIIPFIDELLNDNLNFDSLFYMMENVKGIINIINRPYNSKLCFWKKLKKIFD